MADDTVTERRLGQLRQQLVAARSVPMSASCMVNRADTLALVDEIIAGFQSDLDQVAQEASQEMGRRSWDALDQTDIVQAARLRAAQIAAQSKAEQEELLAEADRYVETRLAAFEAELQVTLSRVATMRDRLINRAAKDQAQDETTVMRKWTI